MSGRVLCVDPDPDERTVTADALREAGFAVTAAGTFADARAAVGPDLDCVVTESTLPDGDALALIAEAREATPDVAGILFTDAGYGAIDTDRYDQVVEIVPKGDSGAHERLATVVETTVARRTQTDYPLPAGEEARLAALATYDLDDPGTRRALDRLTALALARFGVDMASVNLITEDEQRLLACEGLDLGDGPRSASVCTFTILDDDVTVVEDLHEDPRFEAVAALRESSIRAYAGAPVHTPEGHAIGTFCIYDDRPRSFAPDELADLERFAAEAAEQLELRRRLTPTDAEHDVSLGPEADGDGERGR